jgi:hypothetical protein
MEQGKTLYGNRGLCLPSLLVTFDFSEVRNNKMADTAEYHKITKTRKRELKNDNRVSNKEKQQVFAMIKRGRKMSGIPKRKRNDDTYKRTIELTKRLPAPPTHKKRKT